MNIEKASAYFGTSNEWVEDSAIPDQRNEEAIGNHKKNKKQTNNDNFEINWSSSRHPLFYMRSHLSALQNCELISSSNFQFIFTFK